MHKLSIRHRLIILLRPLCVHALFPNGRINKDGQKNKREDINKPEIFERIVFIDNAEIWIE